MFVQHSISDIKKIIERRNNTVLLINEYRKSRLLQTILKFRLWHQHQIIDQILCLIHLESRVQPTILHGIKTHERSIELIHSLTSFTFIFLNPRYNVLFLLLD
jgi:hypothetical protein